MALGKEANTKTIQSGKKDKNTGTELLKLLENSQNTSNKGIGKNLLGKKKTPIV